MIGQPPANGVHCPLLTMPRVSIIIPAYNRESLLPSTLDSLCGQTFPDWEAIVVDDHSQDNTLEVALRYSRQDKRISVDKREGDRKGANVCRRQGLDRARGDYVIFLDSDDLFAATCFERRVAEMDAAPDFDFGIYQTELFAETVGDMRVLWNTYTDVSDLHRFLSLDSVWSNAGPIWRRAALQHLNGIDDQLPSFQDWDLSVRALVGGLKYFKIPVRDHFYRHGPKPVAAISAVSCVNDRHLHSHEKLFERTFTDLQAAHLLDQEARHRITGLFWWLARRWLSISNAPEAHRVWHRTRDLGQSNRRHYWEGRIVLAFRLHTVRGGGRLAQIIQWSWPLTYYRQFSEHLNRVPVTGPPAFISGGPPSAGARPNAEISRPASRPPS